MMSRRLAQGVDASAAPAAPASVRAVVALGANLGDRERTLREAIAEIAALPLVTSVRPSAMIESVAITLEGADPDAPGYLNGVALVDTTLAPSVLLAMLHAIEHRHGRERVQRWGSRTLDLDLVAYADVRSEAPELLLPHPRAAQRDFVLRPWLSIDPDAVIPGVGRADAALAALEGAAKGGAEASAEPGAGADKSATSRGIERP